MPTPPTTPRPVYGNAQIHGAVRFAAGTVARAALRRLFFTDRGICAAALDAAASEAGLVAVVQALRATDKIVEVTAVREEVQRIADVLLAALEADEQDNNPHPVPPEHPGQLTLTTEP